MLSRVLIHSFRNSLIETGKPGFRGWQWVRITITVLAILANPKGQTPDASRAIALVPDRSIERTSSGGRHEYFTVDLKSGEWVRIVVAQQDIDLTLTLVGPGGEKLREISGSKSIDRQPAIAWVADVDGTYQLNITPLNPKARTGTYSVKLIEKRAGTQRDRDLLSAEMRMASAEALLSTAAYENLPRALGQFEEATALLRNVGEPWQTALAMRRQAFIRIIQNNLDAARQLNQDSLSILEAKYGLHHLRLVPALWDLADVVARFGKLPAAREALERALAITKDTVGGDSIQSGITYLRLATLLDAQGDNSAMDACRNAIRIFERHYGKGSLEASGAYALAAGLFQRENKTVEAGTFYDLTLKAIEESFGADSLQVINPLYALAQLRASEGKVDAGVAYQRRILQIVESHFEPRSQQVINSHSVFANFLLMAGRPQAARAEYEIALQLSAQGSDDVANALAGIARTMRAQGHFIESRKKFDEAISVFEARYGKGSQPVLSLLFDKLSTYQGPEDYAEGVKSFAPVIDVLRPVGGAALAEALARAADFDNDHNHPEEASAKYEEAIKIFDRLGEQYVLRAAESRHRLGVNLIELRKADQGLVLVRQALEAYEAIYGSHHAALLEPLSSLAGTLIFLSKFDEAENVLRQSLEIIEKEHLGDQIIAARVFGLMAGLMSTNSKLSAAVEAAQRSLKIYDQRRQAGMDEGENFVRNTLVEAFLLLGMLSQARDVLDKTLDLAQMQPERSLPELRNTRVLMAALLLIQGDNVNAARFLKGFKDVAHSFVQSGDIRAIVYLNYAASLAIQLEMKQEARDFSLEAVSLAESRVGPDHPLTGRIVANQALVLMYAGDYEEAEKVATRASAMLAKPLAEHYGRALPLIVRGETLVRKGKLSEGRAVLEEAQRVIETTIGAQTPFAAKGTNRLAWLRRKEGDEAVSRSLFLHSAEISDNYIQNTLPLLSLAEQNGFLQLEMPEQISGLFTACREGEDLRKAYQSMFRWKGSLVESLRRQAAIARLKSTGQHSAEIEQLTKVKSELAGWYSKFSLVSSTEWNEKNDKLTDEKERLERSLERAIKSGDFVDPLASGLPAFQKLLKPDEAFIDIYAFDYQNADDSQQQRYIAVLTGPTGNPRVVDLGATLDVDAAVRTWRSQVFELKPTVDSQWKVLASMIWNPLADALPTNTLKVWISPDGELARIPWQLLPLTNPKSRTLLLTQADSTREFTRLREAKSPSEIRQRQEVLLIGDIDFNAGGVGGANPEQNHFSRLNGTRTEIEVLGRLSARFRSTHVLTGGDATKAKVKDALQHTDYAHLATHGYFAKETKPLVEFNRGGYRFGSPFGEMTPSANRNPLVESGVALAGANVVDPLTLEAPGLLTAEEITSLDLTRCDLVTLSACDTGRGEEITGQGVLGLRSAVMAAGSRSLLMSLWKVPDRASAELMEAFYVNLWIKKMNKADALLSAQRAVRDKGYPQPINWAGWVLVGDAW